jgi:hypothetical protein
MSKLNHYLRLGKGARSVMLEGGPLAVAATSAGYEVCFNELSPDTLVCPTCNGIRRCAACGRARLLGPPEMKAAF